MNAAISKEIQAEQEHGRQKYGTGPEDLRHDDAHTEDDWDALIEDHVLRLQISTPEERRRELLKVAGLAVSAVESFDRKRLTVV